jgi:hypothetical protein
MAAGAELLKTLLACRDSLWIASKRICGTGRAHSAQLGKGWAAQQKHHQNLSHHPDLEIKSKSELDNAIAIECRRNLSA